MTENSSTEPINDAPEDVDEEILDVDEYEIPVLEDDTDDRFPAFIAGSTLIIRFEDPGELHFPLKVSYNQIKLLQESMSADSEELDQLVFLMEMIGDESLVETLKEMDMADAIAAAVLYFRAWKQRTKVSLGKLRSSSRR